MKQIHDDRTPEQTETHTTIIGGYDRFMSGWGRAEGGASYAFWSCKDQDAESVARWVRSRGDISRIRSFRCRGTHQAMRKIKFKQCHIYVIKEKHPALK